MQLQLTLCAAIALSGVGFGQELEGALPDQQFAQQRSGMPRQAPRQPELIGLYNAFNRVELPALDVAQLQAEDAQQTSLGASRIGVVRPFAPVTNENRGQWTPLAGGEEGWLWTATFKSTGAKGLRLRIRPWNPPSGAELIVYNPSNIEESYGPFTRGTDFARETFWTPVIYADEVRAEFFLPPGLDPRAPESQLVVDGLVDWYRGPGTQATSGGSFNELSCHIDVSCYGSLGQVATSVGALSFNNNQYAFFCSGSLVNRLPSDFTPIFATARHCGVNDSNIESMLVTWLFQTSSCNGSPPSVGGLTQTPGIAVLVNDASTDFMLIGLEDSVPAGIWFTGWNAGYWSNGEAATSIHHPGGAYKRVTFGTKAADVTSCLSGASWRMDIPSGNGEIEPGSSGGPIFSGTAFRGVASCATWSCSSSNSATYGRFDQAWPQLDAYMNSVAPVYVNDSYNGTEEGTVSQPFNRVIESVYAVERGEDVFLDDGTYDEEIVIDKALTLLSTGGNVIIN